MHFYAVIAGAEIAVKGTEFNSLEIAKRGNKEDGTFLSSFLWSGFKETF